MTDNIIHFQEKKIDKIPIMLMFIFFFGALLNHSDIILSVNASASDILLLFLVSYFVLTKELIFEQKSILFFVLLICITIFIAAFIVPYKFDVLVNIKNIVRDGIKLLVLFMYFSVGYSLKKYYEEMSINLIKYFSLAGVMVGLMGIVIITLDLAFMREVLFFGYSRYRGFMNDPNYFSVIMVSTLPYFLRNNNVANYKKIIIFIIVLFSVIISGSKTGTIVFLSYVSFLGLTTLINKDTLIMKKIIMVLLFVWLIIFGARYLDKIFSMLANIMPIINRVSSIFTDFNSAISEGGSGRHDAWFTAISIIKEAPFFGIGVGTYSDVGLSITGSKAIAHNTYLQLMVEWGLFMTTTFLVFIFTILTKVTFNKSTTNEKVVRDIVLIILFGSMGISLNNMRLLWLCLGMLSLKLKSPVLNVVREN